jgi:hypothetical protein
MPLPHSGVGGTLPGGPSGSRAGNAALRNETLFGIAPEQLIGSGASGATPAAPPVKAARPSAGQTVGLSPPAARADRSPPEPLPVSDGALSAGGVPLHGDSPVPNRTLLGVMPDEIAKALDVAREKAPARPLAPARGGHADRPVAPPPVAPPRDLTPPPQAPPPRDVARPQVAPPRDAPLTEDGANAARGGKTAPVRAGAPQPRLAQPPAVEALRGGTMVGSVAAGARGAAPRAMPPGPPPMPAARVPAPALTVVEPGAVRGVALDGDPFGAASIGVDGEQDEDPTVPEGPQPDAAPLPMHARTALGVAIPGIAPLHAGMGAPPARAVPPLEATQLQPDSLAASGPLSSGAAMPRGAFVLLGSGLALLLAAGAFALLWRGSKPISVAISADASGKDRIDLVCPECPDGTQVSLNESRAEIADRKAYLTLAEPLPLGESRVSFGLQRPGEKRPEVVELTLPPVEYRIRPDTSTLGGDQPRLTLKISALPGSKVEIARQLVALDAQGNGEIAVDLSGQLIGPASEVTTFEQAIAYSIAPPSGKVYEGELAFKIGVTPLVLEAPGVDTITDLERFMLAGRTTKGAELWVAGTTISVDAAGRFAQLMSIDSVGETRVTLRATEPGLAPRFASFRLQRVESLENEFAIRRRKAVPLARVSANVADHMGSTVIVSGRVEEARLDGHRALIILQSDGDCGGRSCLVRLVYGGLKKVSRGENITAIGRLQGTVGAPNAAPGSGEVPEVDVSLLL